MNIWIIDMDYEYKKRMLHKSTAQRFPNLALMKISAFYKKEGCNVSFDRPFMSKPDKIFISKVFTFSKDCIDFYANDPEPVRGG